MSTGRKLKEGLSLSCSKMEMRFILKNGLLCINGVADINQQMMMTRVLVIVARMRHAHVAQPEPNPEPGSDFLTIMRGNEVELCVLGGRLAL
ncbi:hypothetical protein XH84_09605 [Bradyrhizobium nanningense]|nr:hypothetical protein XH84_09605 [Bradyrhizobium nanningense]TQF33009.1 hypothetical protein UNPA324_28230 [Bradyrhizobium sp. UNPA324]